MANRVDCFNAHARFVNLKGPCDLFTQLVDMPTQEWKDRHPNGAKLWAEKAFSVDQEFIQKVVNTVASIQFIKASDCFSLESLPLPPADCCRSPFIQHLYIIEQILYRSYGIKVKIDDKNPPQTMTVTWHHDAHWLNPVSPYQIKARKENFRTDCTLQFGKKLFQVHSTVLSAKSSVFETMFRSEYKEAKWGAVINIIMEAFEEQSAEMLIDYFYTGELKLEGASVKRIDNLINFSGQYVMPYLQQLCFEHLCKNVNADNLKEYIALARHYQHEQLEAALIEHIGMEVTLDNFNRLMELGETDKLGFFFTLSCYRGLTKQVMKIGNESPGSCGATRLEEFRKFLDLGFKWQESLMVFTIIGQMRRVYNFRSSCNLKKQIDYLAFVCDYQSRLEDKDNWLIQCKEDIQTMKNDLLENQHVVELIKSSGTQYYYEDNNVIPIIRPINLDLIEKCLNVAKTYRLEEITNSCAAVLEQEFQARPANHTPFTSEELQKILDFANRFDLKGVKEAYKKV